MISTILYYLISIFTTGVLLSASVFALIFVIGRLINPSYNGINPTVIIYYIIFIAPASILSVWISYKLMMKYAIAVRNGQLAVTKPARNYLVSLVFMIVVFLIWLNT